MRLAHVVPLVLAFAAGAATSPIAQRLLPSAHAQASAPAAPPAPSMVPMIIDIAALKDADLAATSAPDLRSKGLVATEHGGLALGGDARAILKGELPVLVALAARPERKRRRDRAGGREGGGVNPVGDPLFEALRALRRDLAAEAQVPPYVIFHDATLREMAAARPADRAALGAIGGIGARKLEAYGDAFLAVIRQL